MTSQRVLLVLAEEASLILEHRWHQMSMYVSQNELHIYIQARSGLSTVEFLCILWHSEKRKGNLSLLAEHPG